MLKITPGTNSYWGSQLTLDATPQSGGLLYLIASLSDGSGEGPGKFLIRDSESKSTFLMDKDGHTGINNLDPSHSLDITGDINFSGSLLKNGNPYGGDYNALENRPDLSTYATKNMGNLNITNLANPVNAQDAATKAYVDALKETIYDEMLDAGMNGILKDIDGNIYKTIKIGSQVWMAENLKNTHFSNGDEIPTTNPPTKEIWGESPATYQWIYIYGGEEYNLKTYGRLYTWFTVADTRGLCPSGWHVPSKVEWTELINYLGGITVAGGKLKETGIIHWSDPNTGATNESGFTALPGGHRYYTGSIAFTEINEEGFWWTSTENYIDAGDCIRIYSGSESSDLDNYYKWAGMSVRCLKD